MEYKGYMGTVTYDSDARVFHGDVVNTRDVITFQGKTVDDIEKAFKESVDDYMNWCRDEGVEPEKPYSGKFNLRISPELHREISIASIKMNMSLNKFVEKALIDELSQFEIKY